MSLKRLLAGDEYHDVGEGSLATTDHSERLAK